MIKITDREYQVLQRLQHDIYEIAEQLCVSPTTVSTHLCHLYKKLGVNTRTQCAIKAIKLDLISPYNFI